MRTSRQASAGGHPHLDRAGLGQPRDVAGHRAVGLVGASWRSPPTCRPRSTTAAPFQELLQAQPGRFRAACCAPWSSARSSRRRVDMLPLALAPGADTMVTGRPGPVNLDIPYNVFQEEADVELPPPSHARRVRIARARATPTWRPRSTCCAAAHKPGALHRPRRHAVGGRPGDSPRSRTGSAFP